MEELCTRLAAHPDLVLPSSLYCNNRLPTSDEVTKHLQSLVTRDAASFLQRYGKLLTQDDLALFEPQRSDYEVNHWLHQYQHQASASGQHSADGTATVRASSGQHRHGSSTAAQRNRRLAAMERLQAQGEYFDMDAMRGRAPLLYHQMLGQYLGDEPPVTEAPPLHAASATEPVPRSAAFSDMLAAREQRAREAQQLKREKEEEEMSEHDTEEEDEEEGEGDLEGRADSTQPNVQGAPASGSVSGGGAGPGRPPTKQLSASALMQKRREFVQEMEHRFLFGHDSAHVDYQAIDSDQQLDEHWAAQAGRDAEDAYFDNMDEDTEQDAGVHSKGGGPAQEHKAEAMNHGHPTGSLGPDEYDY